MHRFVLVLRRNDSSHFDDRLLSLAIAKYKQVLMKLEDKLRSAEDVSAANGFARETNILTCGSLSLMKKLAKQHMK